MYPEFVFSRSRSWCLLANPIARAIGGFPVAADDSVTQVEPLHAGNASVPGQRAH